MTWSWVCPGELPPNGIILKTPAATAGIEVLETYFQVATKRRVCKFGTSELRSQLVEQGLVSIVKLQGAVPAAWLSLLGK